MTLNYVDDSCTSSDIRI